MSNKLFNIVSNEDSLLEGSKSSDSEVLPESIFNKKHDLGILIERYGEYKDAVLEQDSKSKGKMDLI